jgi:hypothetical protein
VPSWASHGKRAIAVEMEVAAARGWFVRRWGRVVGLVGVSNLMQRRDGVQCRRIPTRQSGIVEQVVGEFGIVRHGGLLSVARALAGVQAAARRRPLEAVEPKWLG